MIDLKNKVTRSEVTRHLLAWGEGDETALYRMMPLVAEELRQIAQGYMRREAEGHTLQPTALVNELFLKLAGKRGVQWKNGAHFFGSAADMMQRILVDHARIRQAKKRGGQAKPLSLQEISDISQERDVDLIALDDALKSLAAVDERQSRIVVLSFIVGLSHEEIGAVLGISPRTARREWRTARRWLYREMRRQ